MKFLLILATIVIGCVHADQYSTISTNNLKRVFESALKPAFMDLSSVYHSVKGLALLGENTAAFNTELCTFVKSKVDQQNLESVYYASSVAATVGNCPLGLTNVNALLAQVAGSQNVADLYFYQRLAKLSNVQVDSVKLAKSVSDALKKDNSILNQAYSLHIAVDLAGENVDKPFYDSIDDLLEQADEYDQKYLQYEGGAGVTSLVLDGILRLSEKHKKLTGKLDTERLRKFVNYLTNKRHVSNSKSAYLLLEVSQRLANNQFVIPVIVNRLSGVAVTKDTPSVLVAVTNILGRSVGKQADFTVDASSAVLFQGKKQLTAKSSDNSAFELMLFDAAVKPAVYTVQVAIQAKNDKRLNLVVNNQFQVKFLQTVDVVELSVGAADREQSSPKLTAIQQPGQKLNTKIDADQTSKLHIRFGLKDKQTGSLVSVNQAFVRFADPKAQIEIIFIAEQNPQTKLYSCEVDLGTHAKSFANRNGVYAVQLIVSDSLVQNSRVYDLADFNLRLSEQQQKSTTKASLYQPKPEIKHEFRQPEVTPPKMVSNVFTVLTLLPSIVLIIIWFNLGFNLSKFQFSLSALVFHVAVGGIFGLFYLYWTQFNMFITLRYLGVLALVAIISGKRVLSGLASSALKEKTN